MGMLTACSLDCPDSCSLEATVENGKLVGSRCRPRRSESGTRRVGSAPRSRHTPQLLHGPDRITTPLRRVGPKGSGEFVEITWDEAFDLFAAKVGEAVSGTRLGLVVPYLYSSSAGKLGASRPVAAGVGAPRRCPDRHHDLRGGRRRGVGSHVRVDAVGRSGGPAAQRVDRRVGRQPQRVASAPVAGDRGAAPRRARG